VEDQVAGDDGDSRLYAGDRAEAVSGVGGDVLEVVAVGAEAGADGRFEAGRLGVAAGREAAVGEHQRDQFGSVHQNIA
jgi:hypothetical protein